MTGPQPQPSPWHARLSFAWHIVLAAWIFGAGLFFFLRFSFAFYDANRSAISALFQALSH